MSSATVLSSKIKSSFRDHRSAVPGHTCSRATRSYRPQGTEARARAIGCCFRLHSGIALRSWLLTSTAQAHHPERDDTRNVGREALERQSRSALRARAARQGQERSYGCASSKSTEGNEGNEDTKLPFVPLVSFCAKRPSTIDSACRTSATAAGDTLRLQRPR